MNNDYIYELENHRLQKVSGNSMNLIGGRITDGTLGYQGKVNFTYDEVGRMTSDASKDLNISWRNDDDMPNSILVGKKMGTWEDDLVQLDFGYAGGQIAQFRSTIINNKFVVDEAQYDLLGGKQIRVGTDGKIRAIMYPSYAGAGRTTESYLTSESSPSEATDFYTSDYLGSVVRMNRIENGTLSQTQSREYDVWGRIIQSTESAQAEENDKSFTSQNYENETGLVSFPARRYDADLPRWVSVDAARQHFDLYLYGSNNPINSIDPDGNEDLQIDPNAFAKEITNSSRIVPSKVYADVKPILKEFFAALGETSEYSAYVGAGAMALSVPMAGVCIPCAGGLFEFGSTTFAASNGLGWAATSGQVLNSDISPIQGAMTQSIYIGAGKLQKRLGNASFSVSSQVQNATTNFAASRSASSLSGPSFDNSTSMLLVTKFNNASSDNTRVRRQ